MTTLDFFIIAFALVFALVGFSRGFLVGVLSLAGFALGAWIGTRFGPHLLEEGNASPWAPLFGLLGAVVGGLVLAAGAEGIAGALRNSIRSPAFATFDGVLGALLAVGLALGIAWLLSVVVLQTPGVREWRGTIQRSVILAELNEVLPADDVLNALARFDPLPGVRGPSVNVPEPRSSVARDPDVRRAGRSVVRVLSRACGLGIAGSGWVAAPGVVVTNAHVIAGADETAVETRGGERYGAQAIAFDRRNDVAVLRVPGLPVAPLDFASVVKFTEPGAVLGYPLNGPFTIVPARVGRTATILTQDAYGRRLVRRRVTGIRARVQSGNSGGPVVDVAGRVSGTIFSKLIAASEAGYAVPNEIVREALAGARGPVGTGPCTS